MRQTLVIAFVAVLLHSRPATAGGPPFDVQVCASGCGNAWVGYVNANPGEIAYELFLEPQPEESGVVVGWDLVVFRPAHREENLLEPAGNWHGIQPFSFLAGDLRAGPERGVFGAQRTIRVRGTPATVQVRVVRAQVTTRGPSEELTSLKLHLDVRLDGGTGRSSIEPQVGPDNDENAAGEAGASAEASPLISVLGGLVKRT